MSGRARRRRHASSEDEQPSSSSGSSQNREFSTQVNDLVQFFIVADAKGTPFSRPDMKKTVLQNANPKTLKDVFESARETLCKVYGMDVVELESKKNHYILKNVLCDEDNNKILEKTTEESNKNGLLLIILSMIFMSGNAMKEEHLWATLRCFGIKKEDTTHPVFGEVQKLITREFRDRLYLEIEKPSAVSPSTVYKWGERAKVEVSKKKVLDFVCKVYGDMTPEQWLEQYKEAYET